jgi:hypothetical protein
LSLQCILFVQALELHSHVEYAQELESVLDMLSPAQQQALKASGAAGLQQQLREEKEERMPEFLRPKPKVNQASRWCSMRGA